MLKAIGGLVREAAGVAAYLGGEALASWGRGASRIAQEIDGTVPPSGTEPRCERPPEGWWCSRAPGHDGPCAARRTDEDGPAVAEDGYLGEVADRPPSPVVELSAAAREMLADGARRDPPVEILRPVPLAGSARDRAVRRA